MKRLIAGITVAAATALLTAAPAHAAASTDPVKALQKQFVSGKGVKFTERTTMIRSMGREIVVRRSGSYQFSKSGIAASDITGRFNFNKGDIPEDAPDMMKAMADPERTIRIGKTSYISGGMFGAMMPEGKTWLKTRDELGGGLTGMYGQIINVAEAKTLAVVLRTAKAGKGGYSGSITYGELYKVSPSLRATSFGKPTAKAAKQVVTWKLALDGRSLAQRLVTTFSAKAFGAESNESFSIDTRFTGWGAPITITAPPADDVTTKLDTENGGDDLTNLPFPGGNPVNQ
ncbi:hypothetical protein ACIBG8_24290 [Nonomuraea sp. NPDC050556]|uniref:hypothetical protein n=1 Tax=Nonomuraea sp. NPDC050556 TaxID=3364369 RepID=UPI00379669B9